MPTIKQDELKLITVIINVSITITIRIKVIKSETTLIHSNCSASILMGIVCCADNRNSLFLINVDENHRVQGGPVSVCATRYKCIRITKRERAHINLSRVSPLNTKILINRVGVNYNNKIVHKEMSEGEFARGANYLNAVLIFCIVKFSQSNK
jgi:hypothetical protein